MFEASRIFSAFVRNDLVDGQKILVLECLAQNNCQDAWGGEHYEFLQEENLLLINLTLFQFSP